MKIVPNVMEAIYIPSILLSLLAVTFTNTSVWVRTKFFMPLAFTFG
jgi:hypothetical protein